MIASILTLKKNKRGQITMFIFFGIILVMGIIFYLLVWGIAVGKINSALNQNVSIGQVNLAQINADTIGKYNLMILNSADFMGVASIFGMILGLFLASYVTRGMLPKWGIILDIFIIISVFIFSVYMSQTYSKLIGALATANEPFLEQTIPKTSMFILNLPIFVVVIGVVMLVLFYSSIPRKKEEIVGAGGLQGI